MKLDVWMEGVDRPIGLLERAPNKSLRFAYAFDTSDEARPSLALPIREAPYEDAEARAYFGNLAFEGEQRERIVEVYGIDRDDHAGILHHLAGR